MEEEGGEEPAGRLSAAMSVGGGLGLWLGRRLRNPGNLCEVEVGTGRGRGCKKGLMLGCGSSAEELRSAEARSADANCRKPQGARKTVKNELERTQEVAAAFIMHARPQHDVLKASNPQSLDLKLPETRAEASS